MATVTPVHETFWRVTVGEQLLGYIDQIEAADGTRFRARRLNVRHRRWVALGEYWDMEAAVQALVS